MYSSEGSNKFFSCTGDNSIKTNIFPKQPFSITDNELINTTNELYSCNKKKCEPIVVDQNIPDQRQVSRDGEVRFLLSITENSRHIKVDADFMNIDKSQIKMN